MREDIYGPKLWAIINEATEPITAATLTKAAGCSKQRTYQWLAQAREQGVIEVGRNTRGAALFALKQTARRRADGNRTSGAVKDAGTHAHATTILSIDPRSMLGVALQVTGVRLSTDGGYVLELAGDDGVSIQVHASVDGRTAGGDGDGDGHVQSPRRARSTAKS